MATSGRAVTQIEMLAMSDLSLMVKAGVQWGLFGGAIENLGTERHHEAYVQKLIDLELLGCFAMDRGPVTAATCRRSRPPEPTDQETREFVIGLPHPVLAQGTTSGGAANTARVAAVLCAADHRRWRVTACTASSYRSATTTATTCRGVTTSDCQYKGWAARRRQRPHPVRPGTHHRARTC